MQRSEPKMKNVAIILQDLRSGGSERFASRLSHLLSEKFNVYVLVFDASEKRFDCSGEFVDLKLPAGKGTAKRAIIMLKRTAAIKKIRQRTQHMHGVFIHPRAERSSRALGCKVREIYLLPRLCAAHKEPAALFIRAAARVQYSLQRPRDAEKMRRDVPWE